MRLTRISLSYSRSKARGQMLLNLKSITALAQDVAIHGGW